MWIRIDLVYTAPDPVLDGNLMNSLPRRTAEPLLAAGIAGLTMVSYVNINDPTGHRHGGEKTTAP